MDLFLIILIFFVRALLMAEWLLILVSVILSWVAPEADGGIFDLVYYLTEPVVAPFRKLLSKIPALQELPIDFSTMFAMMVISFLMAILEVI